MVSKCFFGGLSGNCLEDHAQQEGCNLSQEIRLRRHAKTVSGSPETPKVSILCAELASSIARVRAAKRVGRVGQVQQVAHTGQVGANENFKQGIYF